MKILLISNDFEDAQICFENSGLTLEELEGLIKEKDGLFESDEYEFQSQILEFDFVPSNQEQFDSFITFINHTFVNGDGSVFYILKEKEE